MDKSGGSIGCSILGIQQRKKHRNIKRKLKIHCFSHVGQVKRHFSRPFFKTDKLAAEFLWSHRTRWKRRRYHEKGGVGQTEAKLARVREEAGAERNMKSWGRQDFMMENIMFSQKGAGMIKVEEDGSIGLALKMSPHLDTRILFRSTE